MVKNPPANAGLIPGSGRSPGGRNSNQLQYSCQKNSMDRGAWWATVHGVSESDMAELLSTHLGLWFPTILLNTRIFFCISEILQGNTI